MLPSFLPSHSLHSLHGHLPPAKRTLTLQSFVSHPSTPQSPSVLLCTDVAARGLDLPDVDCVIQFDPPVDPKQFSHRCGRTARAGREGRAWVLLGEKEMGYVGQSGHLLVHPDKDLHVTDFMSIRKIPLKQQPYINDTNSEASSSTLMESEDRPEDPAVQSTLVRMRTIALKDRNVHDKVTCYTLDLLHTFVRSLLAPR